MTTASGTKSFDRFAKAHQRTLYALALRLSGNPADAADLVQDTFERALRSYGSLPPGANERAWVITILHNRFIDGCRRKKRTPVHEQVDEASVPAAPPADDEPAWAEITPTQVRAALAQIGEEFRVVYELATEGNRTYKEIAEQLSLPPATVGTRLIRARRKLRRLLTPLVREAA